MNQKAWKKPKDSDKGPFLNIVILFHPPIKFLHFSLSICYGHFQPRRAFSFPASDCFECVVPLGCWGSHMLASLSLWPDSTNTPRSMGPDTKIAVNPAKHHQHHVAHRTHDNLDTIKTSYIQQIEILNPLHTFFTDFIHHTILQKIICVSWASWSNIWEIEGRPTCATFTEAPSWTYLRGDHKFV